MAFLPFLYLSANFGWLFRKKETSELVQEEQKIKEIRPDNTLS